MASELRLLLLPFALCALAVSIVLQRQYQSANAPTTPPPVEAPDAWRSPPSFPKPDPAPGPESGYLVAHIKAGRSVSIRSHPNGRVLDSLGSRTEFGSARALSVVRDRRGRWLGVTTPQLPNGKLGWVDARSGAFRYSRASVELEIDLSRRLLAVRRADEVVRRVAVSIGRPGSPTPGRPIGDDLRPFVRTSQHGTDLPRLLVLELQDGRRLVVTPTSEDVELACAVDVLDDGGTVTVAGDEAELRPHARKAGLSHLEGHRYSSLG